MVFNISVKISYYTAYYKVERLPVVNNRERYKLTWQDQELIVSNNRPILKRHRLKHWEVQYKLDQGQVPYTNTLTLIGAAIEAYLKSVKP
jgi:hypothetical protein